VLAVELLRQHYQGVYDESLPSRSETIQDLSVFISCLEWVARLGIGNHVACSEARGILKRIMDRILLPPPRPPPPSQWTPTSLPQPDSGTRPETTNGSYGIPNIAAPSISMNMEPASNGNVLGFNDGSGEIDFMTWLDNMDLDMGNFINFNALWDSTGMVNG
jgi:hypothetical protein